MLFAAIDSKWLHSLLAYKQVKSEDN